MKFLLPPVMFTITLIAMAAVCQALGSPHLLTYPLNLFGIVLLAAGLGVSAYHSRLFKQEGANIMTFDEPTRFVTGGLFRYSRNPMYLGFVIALVGVAFLYQAAISSFIMVAAFWLITDLWYIRYEEAKMLEIYGEEYRDYCARTPRWFGFS